MPKLIKSWFEANKNTAMQWPGQSHDLTPIENLWKQLDDKICLHGRFRNAEELYQELQTAWSQIKQVHIDKLVKSMPHKFTEVKNNGH